MTLIKKMKVLPLKLLLLFGFVCLFVCFGFLGFFGGMTMIKQLRNKGHNFLGCFFFFFFFGFFFFFLGFLGGGWVGGRGGV